MLEFCQHFHGNRVTGDSAVMRLEITRTIFKRPLDVRHSSEGGRNSCLRVDKRRSDIERMSGVCTHGCAAHETTRLQSSMPLWQRPTACRKKTGTLLSVRQTAQHHQDRTPRTITSIWTKKEQLRQGWSLTDCSVSSGFIVEYSCNKVKRAVSSPETWGTPWRSYSTMKHEPAGVCLINIMSYIEISRIVCY